MQARGIHVDDVPLTDDQPRGPYRYIVCRRLIDEEYLPPLAYHVEAWFAVIRLVRRAEIEAASFKAAKLPSPEHGFPLSSVQLDEAIRRRPSLKKHILSFVAKWKIQSPQAMEKFLLDHASISKKEAARYRRKSAREVTKDAPSEEITMGNTTPPRKCVGEDEGDNAGPGPSTRALGKRKR
jgi:hypothetical protein